jgi:hypothetical protein
MSSIREHAAVPLGILLAIVYLVLVYLLEGPFYLTTGPIQSLVYTNYVRLVIPNQEFAVAWLLATIDRLLSYSLPLSLPLWIILLLIASITLRKTSVILQLVGTTLIFLGGTWVLFAVKYFPTVGIDLNYLFNFILWRLFVPSFLTLFSAWCLTIPFWLWRRTQVIKNESPDSIRFECMSCGAVFQSNPTICVVCGAKQSTREKN